MAYGYLFHPNCWPTKSNQTKPNATNSDRQWCQVTVKIVFLIKEMVKIKQKQVSERFADTVQSLQDNTESRNAQAPAQMTGCASQF